MKRFSHIWIWISLGLLGIFLAIWVFDSYREEKKRLEGEIQLELAQLILSKVDIDFPQLIELLKMGNTSEQTLSINVDSLDDLNGVQVKKAIRLDSYQSFDTIFQHKIFTDSSLQDLVLSPEKLRVTKPKVLITTTHEDDFASNEALRNIFPEKYQKEYDTAVSGVPLAAFLGIIPQLLLALGLLGTITFAVVMLQRNYRQKELEMETKSQFISNMTHELKTPVATIGIALEAIQDFKVNPEKTQQYMETSRSELKRLGKLIDQVMAASQTHHDPTSYYKEVIAFPEMVRAVLNSLAPQIEDKKAEVNLKIQEDNAVMLGDISHITNMLRNLLDNSLKYSQKGVEILLQLQIDKDKLHFRIRDNGIGIPDRFQKKVFEQFFRVPTGDIHTVKGYGLGLNYVAQVVRAHEGKIQLNSREGEGTEILIILPLYHG